MQREAVQSGDDEVQQLKKELLKTMNLMSSKLSWIELQTNQDPANMMKLLAVTTSASKSYRHVPCYYVSLYPFC